MRSRPAANMPVNVFAAVTIAWQAEPLVEAVHGALPGAHIDPERSSTIMMTTSLRDATPLAETATEPMPNHFMKYVGALVDAATVTVRRFVLLGSLATLTL